MKPYIAALASMAMIGGVSTVAFAANSAAPVRASASLPATAGATQVDVRKTKVVREKDRAVPDVAIALAATAAVVTAVVLASTNDSPG